jgi:hypothetical protein
LVSRLLDKSVKVIENAERIVIDLYRFCFLRIVEVKKKKKEKENVSINTIHTCYT